MSSDLKLADAVRDAILETPDAVLEDKDLMHALIGADSAVSGSNVVDLRSVAMLRMEARFERLEDVHKTVIAAAYENVSGTNQIHRAILRMLDPDDFEDFLLNLTEEVADILRTDEVRLVLETAHVTPEPAIRRLSSLLRTAVPGYVDYYMAGGRSGGRRAVALRQVQWAEPEIYGATAATIKSEACLRLDFGPGRLPGMLILGTEDPQQFTPHHATDLLAFFGGVFERAMRQWLR
jgi:uncharacterized protein YigA (DUF484 family)